MPVGINSLNSRKSNTIGLSKIALATLFVLVASIPMEQITVIPGIGSISRLIGIASFVVVVVLILSNGWVRSFLPLHFLVGMFTVWGMTSYQWTAAPTASLIRIGTFLQVFILMLIIWQVCVTNAHLELLLYAFLLGTTLIAFQTIWEYLFTNPVAYRYSVMKLNANDQALTVSLAVPAAIYLALQSRNRVTRLALYIFLAAAAVAVILTGSRGGFAALTVSGISLFVPERNRNKIKPALFLLFAFLALYYANLLPLTQLERIGTLYGEVVQGGSFTNRKEIWSNAFEIFSQHRFLGVGVGAFRAVEYAGRAPHNAFISIAVELGLVGSLFFLSILFSLVLSLKHLNRSEKMMWAFMLVTWLVGSMSLNWEYRKTTWLLFALIATWVGNARKYTECLSHE